MLGHEGTGLDWLGQVILGYDSLCQLTPCEGRFG